MNYYWEWIGYILFWISIITYFVLYRPLKKKMMKEYQFPLGRVLGFWKIIVGILMFVPAILYVGLSFTELKRFLFDENPGIIPIIWAACAVLAFIICRIIAFRKLDKIGYPRHQRVYVLIVLLLNSVFFGYLVAIAAGWSMIILLMSIVLGCFGNIIATAPSFITVIDFNKRNKNL